MGNLNIKGYTPSSKEPVEGGVNNVWKIYQAQKKSIDKEGSIFVFDKKKYASFNLDKDKKEANFDILKKEASNLSRYMHPNVLKILEPFHEDANVIAFVTEPVECSLAQILHQKRDIPIRSDLTELKIILMELLEGIIYLNEKTNSAHLNLCPENIYMTSDGKWKIGGFGFLYQSEVAVSF
jgi:SCY1-like protein 2